jgi:hypothetical protein
VNSFAIIDGDLLIDSRGRIVLTSGKIKVTGAINYALSNSAYIQNLFSRGAASNNDDAIRSAILSTIQELIQLHRTATWLKPDERIAKISKLQVSSVDKTSFTFAVEVSTYANESFNVVLERS